MGFLLVSRGAVVAIGGMGEYRTVLDDVDEWFFLWLLVLLPGCTPRTGVGQGNSTGSRGMWTVGDGVISSLLLFFRDWRRGCCEPEGDGVIKSLAAPVSCKRDCCDGDRVNSLSISRASIGD